MVDSQRQQAEERALKMKSMLVKTKKELTEAKKQVRRFPFPPLPSPQACLHFFPPGPNPLCCSVTRTVEVFKFKRYEYFWANDDYIRPSIVSQV